MKKIVMLALVSVVALMPLMAGGQSEDDGVTRLTVATDAT